jgi:hypothetical protein
MIYLRFFLSIHHNTIGNLPRIRLPDNRKVDQPTFVIFDAFSDDAGRDAHLSRKVAKALMKKAAELIAEPPTIEKADVLADRLSGYRPKVTLRSGSLLICPHSLAGMPFPGLLHFDREEPFVWLSFTERPSSASMN